MSNILATFVIMPILVYAGLGFASATFVWASAQTTPLWQRYLLCVGVGMVVGKLPELLG